MPFPLGVEYEALPFDILKVSRSLYSAMRNASWYICALLASGSFRGNVGVTVQAAPTDYLLGLGEYHIFVVQLHILNLNRNWRYHWACSIDILKRIFLLMRRRRPIVETNMMVNIVYVRSEYYMTYILYFRDTPPYLKWIPVYTCGNEAEHSSLPRLRNRQTQSYL